MWFINRKCAIYKILVIAGSALVCGSCKTKFRPELRKSCGGRSILARWLSKSASGAITEALATQDETQHIMVGTLILYWNNQCSLLLDHQP